MTIRAEYSAWEIEVLLDFYRFTGQKKHLARAIKLGNELKRVQAPNGAFYFSDTDKRIWSGEPGLCGWSLYKLYHYTKNNDYKKRADKAIEYIKKNPVQRRQDEKRLYYVFVAWNAYPFIIRWQLFKNNRDKEQFIHAADRLVNAQKLSGRWTIALHYDLYVAWVLMYAYNETKNKKYLNAVLAFLRFAKFHKTPLGLYSIHYLPFGLIELGSGYSTNQMARLNYYLYFTTGEKKYKETADALLPAIASRLKRGNGIAKLYAHKTKNDLATMWYEHNKLLKGTNMRSKDYFTITKSKNF